jgi:hypothetical protein
LRLAGRERGHTSLCVHTVGWQYIQFSREHQRPSHRTPHFKNLR